MTLEDLLALNERVKFRRASAVDKMGFAGIESSTAWMASDDNNVYIVDGSTVAIIDVEGHQKTYDFALENFSEIG